MGIDSFQSSDALIRQGLDDAKIIKFLRDDHDPKRWIHSEKAYKCLEINAIALMILSGMAIPVPIIGMVVDHEFWGAEIVAVTTMGMLSVFCLAAGWLYKPRSNPCCTRERPFLDLEVNSTGGEDYLFDVVERGLISRETLTTLVNGCSLLQAHRFSHVQRKGVVYESILKGLRPTVQMQLEFLQGSPLAANDEARAQGTILRDLDGFEAARHLLKCSCLCPKSRLFLQTKTLSCWESWRHDRRYERVWLQKPQMERPKDEKKVKLICGAQHVDVSQERLERSRYFKRLIEGDFKSLDQKLDARDSYHLQDSEYVSLLPELFALGGSSVDAISFTADPIELMHAAVYYDLSLEGLVVYHRALCPEEFGSARMAKFFELLSRFEMVLDDPVSDFLKPLANHIDSFLETTSEPVLEWMNLALEMPHLFPKSQLNIKSSLLALFEEGSFKLDEIPGGLDFIRGIIKNASGESAAEPRNGS